MSNSKLARSLLAGAALVVCLNGTATAAELDGPASIVFDQHRVPTIVAQTEHDAIYLQGYMHARDRLFQMDLQRRAFAGKLAELLGPALIPQDVQLRTLGLDRAAVRSLAVQTPETMAWLEAYAKGVNAYLRDTSLPLPPEYGPLEIDRNGIPPWTPLDSLLTAKGLAWNLSFDLSDIDRTLALLNFLGVCDVLGCNGLQLLQSDLYRVAPFEAQRSIPPSPPPVDEDPEAPPDEEIPSYITDPDFGDVVQSYRDTLTDVPLVERTLEPSSGDVGSNWWLASGAVTDSGFPMIANDPHLSLGNPATFYEIHLNVAGGINVAGVSFPGAPGIVQGCNDTICWGSSVNAQDVTDVYQEVLLALDPSQPTTPTHSFFDGVPEPLTFIPQTFLFNAIGDGVPNTIFDAGLPASSGGVTLVVPRRNNGPIVDVSFNPATGRFTGISVQYVGWSATQELETFRRFARAASMQDFKDALQYFDFGSQNWGYADINGNIAYYTSGEVPIREDLQLFFFPIGLIWPGLIRDGTHTNRHEWLPLQNPQPNQALSTEILPFAEMPQTENPVEGYILNANNDPIGTTFDNTAWNQFRAGFNGVLYLSSGYATGYRMGRLQRLFDSILAGGGTLSQSESIAVQANNQLLDAEILSPYLQTAYDNAIAPGAPPELSDIVADPRIGDAIGRIAAWDFSTPTGIDQGWDPSDSPGVPGPAPAAEIDASVAATIYAVWRGQLVQRVIDQTLANLPIPLDAFAPPSDLAMSAVRRLLERYPVNGGVGSSLINFFQVPGVADQDVARDIILLESLQNGLDLLASPEFAPAFGGSTDLNDYRWGKLHRVVFAHPLGGPFNIPPAGSPDNVGPELPGFARAGGMGVLDASSHSARADKLHDFMFGSGPARRKVAIMKPTGPEVLEVIPGGESGIPGSPFQTDQLVLWLVNDYHVLWISLDDVNANAVATETYECGDGNVGPGETCDPPGSPGGVSGNTCRADCTVCGDGILDAGEECDDGNTNGNDGCDASCRISPIISCGNPTVDADPDTCTAAIACDVIASCTDPEGGAVTFFCAPEGPYGLGTTDVTVDCSDAQSDNTVAVCPATVVDVTPPTIDVSPDPDELWPPNHRMVEVNGGVTASDTCGPVTYVLDSITSDEPDDAPGGGDGNTTNDIQNADYGTQDDLFDLRAERQGGGDGRTYTVTYTATDGSGNQASASGTVFVPHDQGGVTEPLELTVEENDEGTALRWTRVQGSQSYNVIRGKLSELRDLDSVYDLATVACVENASPNESSHGNEDAEIPAPGEVFLYMVEFSENTGKESAYGTVSASKPRKPAAGDCPGQ